LKTRLISIGIPAIVAILIILNLSQWKVDERVIEHDVRIYYGYLPATFIFNDPFLERGEYNDGRRGLFWQVTTPQGHKTFKMTSGMAMMYLPFFVPAHLYSKLSGNLPNGFSEPYKFFILIGAVFYLVIGLEFIRKTLLHLKFSDLVTASTVLVTGLTTNLLCYASQSGPMPHVYSFALIAIFIFATIKFWETKGLKYIVALGVTFGLITLIRPTNALIGLFFILYGKDLIFSHLKTNTALYQILLFVSLVVIIWLPQLYYWKFSTGHLLSYTYNDERFFFNDPKILQGLFSFRKGWLMYTPVMVFALLGIYLLRGELRRLQIPILVFTLLNIYIIFSWWCWWYGGTYGQRALIDSYALLAIPLAAFLRYVNESGILLRSTVISAIAFFTWLNIFQTYQFEYHSLHWDGMNRELYFKQFGRLEKVEGHDAFIHWPDYEAAKKGDR